MDTSLDRISALARSSMELHSYTTVQLFLLLLAAVISSLLLRRCDSGRPAQWPPGPPAWPVIGHLHLLGKLPHQSLSKLSSTYGPLMGLRLGSVRAIVASSPQMAKEILQTHDLTFAHRPRLAAAEHMFFNCSDIAGSPDTGPVWKRMRQLCATELFTPKRLAHFRHVREDEVRGMVRALMEMGKRAVEVRPIVVAATNNIICRMALGKKITEFSTRMGKQDLLQSLVRELLHLVGVFYVGDLIPWLWWVDPHGSLKRMKAAGRKAKALAQEVIQERRQERVGRPHAEEDLLDLLLAAAAATDPKQEDARITDDNVMGVIMDLFTGGADTSSITVEWALVDLLNNEQVMHKLQKEIATVVGNERLVTESDIENLPYLTLVIKESMRLHPVAPFLIPRESSKECQIGEYKIPAKTRAYINTWAMGRDPLIWDMPLRFWPERFLNSKFDSHEKSFELLPFGAGRRRCPGVPLALLNVHLMLASLVQGFSFSIGTSNDQSQDLHSPSLDMSECFGLSVVMKKPLCMFFTPRLPLHMY